MSGDSSTSTTSRLSTIKKYPGSPMSPNTTHSTSGARAASTRNRVLTHKIAAPRPINLPSLRRENAASSEWPASTAPSSVIAGGNGVPSSWGSPSPALSPFSSPQKTDNAEPKAGCQGTATTGSNNPSTTASNNNYRNISNNHPTSPVQLSPVLSKTSATSHESQSPVISPRPTPSCAWAAPVPAVTVAAAPADFLKAAEGAFDLSKKSEKNDRSSGKSVVIESEHLDWDEMVRQDLEAHFDDNGLQDTLTPPESETVLPSDRFTEDYDRSYPPQICQVTEDQERNDGGHHTQKSHRENGRRENGFNNAYNWREGHSRPGSSASGSGSGSGSGFHHDRDRDRGSEWRPPGDHGAPRNREHTPRVEQDRSRSQNRFERRTSHDKKQNFQPTVLQRPRRVSDQSARSERSRDEHTAVHESTPSALDSLPETTPTRPTELTAAQREVMLSAAERAKKRRDEEEAEREAARERARQKALALAPMGEKQPKQSATMSGESKDGHNDNPDASEARQDPPSHLSVSNDQNRTPLHRKPADDKVEQPKDMSPKAEPVDDALKKKDAKSSAPTPKERTDDDEDVAEWNEYVDNLRDNKDRGETKGAGASAWNAYAERLQVKDEERWHKSVEQYAAERDLDPTIFRGLRKFDKSPSARCARRESNNGKEQGKRRDGKGSRGERRRSASGKLTLDNEEMWPSLDKAPGNKAENSTATEIVAHAEGPAAAGGRGGDKKADFKETGLSTTDASVRHISKNNHDNDMVVEATSVRANSDLPTIVPSHPSESSSTESKVLALALAVSTPTPEKASSGQDSMISELLRVNWERKERRELLLRSERPIFPPEVEQLAGKKPPHLSFMIDTAIPVNPSYATGHHGRDQSLAAYPSTRENVGQADNNKLYVDQPVSQGPPIPFNTPGNPNYPVVFYQMPYSNGSYMPNTPMYAVRPEQQQQQGSFVHGTSPQQQQQQQQQRFVYLVPPQHMIPQWPGMPVQFNNPRRHR